MKDRYTCGNNNYDLSFVVLSLGSNDLVVISVTFKDVTGAV